MRAAAGAERAALEAKRLEAERAAVQSAVSLLQTPKSEGDMPRDDFGDRDQALPGYTPGWRHSLPSSPLSSPSVSVFGPGLGHQRDWGWDPGGGVSGKRSAAVCGGVCEVGEGSLVGPPLV